MPVLFKKYYPTRNILFFLGEGTLIFITVIVIQVLFAGSELFGLYKSDYILRAVLVTVVFQLSLYFFDLYDLGVLLSFMDTATRITQAFGIGCIMLAAIYYLFPPTIIATKTFWAGYLVICCCIAIWRSIYFITLRKRLFTQPIILFGSGKLAKKIHTEISSRMDSGFNIVAYIAPEKMSFELPPTARVYDKPDKLYSIYLKHEAERIVVALEDRRGAIPAMGLISCRLNGCTINNGVSFYEELTGKIMVEKAKPDWIIYSDGFNNSRLSTFIKRLTDITLSMIGLIVSAPITIMSAILIKLETPGPVFYTQERVGRHNSNFNVIKFRSMGVNAEKDGAVWASVNDSRVTRVGHFIRKTRIDEIPQMWNILKGEMSFVGPRPERPVFVEQLNSKIPYYSMRHYIKPGLTGLAQICYPYGASDEDALRKLEYDLYYLKNASFPFDLWITFQTIKTVMFKKGGR